MYCFIDNYDLYMSVIQWTLCGWFCLIDVSRLILADLDNRKWMNSSGSALDWTLRKIEYFKHEAQRNIYVVNYC